MRVSPDRVYRRSSMTSQGRVQPSSQSHLSITSTLVAAHTGISPSRHHKLRRPAISGLQSCSTQACFARAYGPWHSNLQAHTCSQQLKSQSSGLGSLSQFQLGSHSLRSTALGRPPRAMRAAMQASSSTGISSTAMPTLTQAALQQADLSQLEGKLKIIGQYLLQVLSFL